MSLKVVEGDLIKMALDGEFDVVAHGCNGFHVMGAGIAPQMNAISGGKLLEADKETPWGDINKLGTTSSTIRKLKGGVDLHLFNLYTQFTFGGHGVQVHWESVTDAILEMILSFDTPTEMRFGIPLIGCGLAGGNERDFFEFVPDMKEIDMTVVRYNK